MPLRPCLDCGRPTTGSRCRTHQRAHEGQRGSTSARGYGPEWRVLRAEAIRLHPYCSVPGCRDTDLTVDHIDPASKGRTGLTLADVQVLCRSHNSSKGNRPPGGRGSSKAGRLQDPVTGQNTKVSLR
jgi:5-methylcytosine-specific restriction enzyme A